VAGYAAGMGKLPIHSWPEILPLSEAGVPSNRRRRRIEGTDGMSGPPPIATKSAGFGYGRCPAGSHATSTAIGCP